MSDRSELERNVQNLVDAKILNLDVTLSTLVKGGGLASLDPWDVFCGNGWIIRRRFPGPVVFRDLDSLRDVVQQEIRTAAAGR